MANVLTDILRAASKHPNSRVSKLIYTVEEDPSQKNIVLLLIELAEHAEYSTDFNISLKYYLDLFERSGINSDLVLNEAGLLLVNSSKIYAKRVDYVQSLVERQILTLSNADNELQQQKLNQQESSTESATPAEKPKRGRKRALDVPSDPYEVELVPKKIKKLSEEKRFAVLKTATKPKSIQRNIEMEQHIHPAGWMHATIYDLDNEEDVDTKRNYKLFTYHIEHRYNTLVPDINFRLHFKVKDYMDAQEEEMDEDEACNTDRSWPPLSEAYVQKYIKLENYVLQQDHHRNKRKAWAMDDDYDNGNEIGGTENNTESLTNKNLNEKQNGNPTENPINVAGDNTINPLNNAEDKTKHTVNDAGDKLESPAPNPVNDAENKTENPVNDSGEKSDNPLTDIGEKLENSLNNTVSQMDLSVQHLNTSDVNESKNDSGLGQSLLDDSNKADTTQDATQLDITIENTSALNSTTLEHSATPENLNDASQQESDKSINLTQTLQENDSALGTSILDQNNITDISGNLNMTNCNETNAESTEKLNTTNCNETNESLNVNQCPESKETTENLLLTTENDNNILENADSSNTVEDNLVSKETEAIKNSEATETNSNAIELKETTDASTEVREITNYTMELIETAEFHEINVKLDNGVVDANNQPLKATDARKDSALSDDRQLSVSRENLSTLNIDIVATKDGDRSRIRISLPNTDDEGVYLSDLDDNDHRLLSPTVLMTNILPGVQRKDITIHMDEELRQALELRDGIMEHFGRETYNVPVVTEPKKQNLYFNILKLPEKIIRKKVLFKLGPEMDLYLQARSLKRKRPDEIRECRTTKLLKWFSLNNTDMTGIIMTPPNSPGHCSEFCGFTDDESCDDVVSCSEFCGFTNDEQESILLKNLHRLSRDSGVGYDANNLTPEKETLEIIFEEKGPVDAEICKKNLNFEENKDESTENLLNKLPDDIRDLLRAEINDGIVENNKEATCEIPATQEEVIQQLTPENIIELVENSINNTEETEKLSTENSSELLGSSINNSEETEKLSTDNVSESLSTENSSELLGSSINNSEETEKLSTENVSETLENSLNTEGETEKLTTEISSELTEADNLGDMADNTEIKRSSKTITDNQYQDLNEANQAVEIVCDQPNSTEDLSKNSEKDLKNANNADNICDQNNTISVENHEESDEDSDDDTMLELNIEGTKTKIQQWHEHLQPILAKSRERHHFDVFKLGTEIIETVQNKKSSSEEDESMSSQLINHPVASFHDVMDNRDKSYVSRYFLSTLLLANQSNVEITLHNKSSENPSSWQDIELKLLSTKRHTVAIEDNIGMISNKKKTAPKENDKIIKTKEAKQIPIVEDDDDDEEPLIMLQESTSKFHKKSKTAPKRTSSDNISIFPIVEKKPKESSLITSNESLSNLITSVQILPPLTTTTTSSSSLTSKSLPEIQNVFDIPCTSRQAKEQQALEVSLNSVRTLQPIEKVSRHSDDYDSGIFSIDELSR